MRTLLATFILSFACFSCGGGDINQIQPGMDQSKVIEIMGNPDDVLHSNMQDSSGGFYEVTIWQYGANQGVVLYGGKVEQVIPDVDKLMRELKDASGQ